MKIQNNSELKEVIKDMIYCPFKMPKKELIGAIIMFFLFYICTFLMFSL